MLNGRIQVPPSVKRGEAFEVRILVQHPMETGFRRDADGRAIALNIVNRVVCRLAGREVFSAELGTGMAANPYIAFYATAQASSELEVEWSDDRGENGKATATITVA